MVTQKADKLAVHWKRLSLMPGAPECVIKIAYRFHIRMAHPDAGGSTDDAVAVNTAHDQLKGQGAAATERVPSYSSGEPFQVLGLAANADAELARQAAD